MHLVFNNVKKIGSILLIYGLSTQAYADHLCSTKRLCDAINLEKQQILTLSKQTQFVSNAPLSILDITQTLWQKRMFSCKTKPCLLEQLAQHTQELNEFATLNQTLTQHFIQNQHGKIATRHAYLQIHQLEQNKLKIDGYAYTHQYQMKQHFLAYSQSTDLNNITNNEDGCRYNIKLSKALLNIQSEQKKCQLFAGNYRRYD